MSGLSQAGAVVVLASGLLLHGHPAVGEIHDYMIRRLVYLGTSCGADTISPVKAAAGHRRFHIVCHNTTAYPEGLSVDCSDPEDDRSCLIEEKPREFDKLDLLRPPGQR